MAEKKIWRESFTSDKDFSRLVILYALDSMLSKSTIVRAAVINRVKILVDAGLVGSELRTFFNTHFKNRRE